MGKLYLVSTPIGNLQDITLRAIEVLFAVDLIACEDTRKTGLLLQNLITKENVFLEKATQRPRLVSYYEQNEAKRIPELINELISGKQVALVSNAGTPTISDPGYKLIRACLQEGILVEPVPGPSALLAALTVSGLPTDKFIFLGFLPKKMNKRKKALKDLSDSRKIVKATAVAYVSPYRLVAVLHDLRDIFGDIPIVLCQELTKKFEKTSRGKISTIIGELKKEKVRGEFVLVF